MPSRARGRSLEPEARDSRTQAGASSLGIWRTSLWGEAEGPTAYTEPGPFLWSWGEKPCHPQETDTGLTGDRL